jgi:hypothetical protein
MFFLLFIYLYLDGVLRHFVPLPVKSTETTNSSFLDYSR